MGRIRALAAPLAAPALAFLALAALAAARPGGAQDGATAQPATAAPAPARPSPTLQPSTESVQRLDAAALVFPRKPPLRLATGQLRLSGIDPEDVRRTLQAWNQRSELLTFRGDSVAIAPYLLRNAFDMGPDKLLQVRVGSTNARLVLQLEWR
jgi:hypothetical protein